MRSVTDFVVTRVAGSVVMLDQTYPADVNAGFSPDSLCIVVNTLNQGTFGTQLYDLTGTTAKPLCEDYAVGGTQASTAFLPHGEWFVVQQVTGSGSAGLTVISTLDGSRVLNRSYTFSSPPGSPGDQ